MEKYKQDFIEFLVKAGALKFGDFTLKSGRKCPYFLNMGQFNTGSLMAGLGQYYAEAIAAKVKEYDVIFGPAYKGIPLSVTVSLMLYQKMGVDKSYSFNRKEAKDHGEGGLIVGAQLGAETKVVIVDDVMTAGTALRETLDMLKTQGNPKVVGVMIAVDRMEKGQGEKSAAQEVKEKFGIEVYSIVSILEVVEFLRGRQIDGRVVIGPEQIAAIEEYRKQYGV